MSSAIFEQIATKVGVSPSTVQRILNRPLKDQRPTIRRRADQIRALAAELNYRPNQAAKATATGRFGCVSLVMSRDAGISPHGNVSRAGPGLYDGVLDELSQRDFHLTLHQFRDEQFVQEGFLPKVLRTDMSDGLLVNYAYRIPARMIEVIRQDHVPTVWINVKMANDSVHPDDFAAGRMATDHLIQRGAQSIGYLHIGTTGVGEGTHYSGQDRLDGYLAAMQAAGLAPQVQIEQWNPASSDSGNLRDGRFELACAYLARPDRPEAVVTYSPAAAQPLLAAALSRGLRVPDELSVVTIGDALCSDTGLALTTVLFGAADLGRASARMLLDKLRNPNELIRTVKIPARLVIGQTSK
jgi:LacI family transcriptional regulator